MSTPVEDRFPFFFFGDNTLHFDIYESYGTGLDGFIGEKKKRNSSSNQTTALRCRQQTVKPGALEIRIVVSLCAPCSRGSWPCVKFPASFRFLHRSIRWRTSKSKQKVATIPDRYYIRRRDQVNELKETLLSNVV